MKKLLLLLFLIPIVIKADAQELSKAYLDSVKQFFRSKPLDDWMHRGYNTIPFNPHPSIALHPVYLRSSDTTGNHERVQKWCSYSWHSVVYQLTNSTDGTYATYTDSIVLTEKEKTDIAEQSVLKAGLTFTWSTDYFSEATFPFNWPDSIFQASSTLPHGAYHIGLPLFLRNSTICVFYYALIFNGGRGHQDHDVYKKENGGWNYFGSFAGGDW